MRLSTNTIFQGNTNRLMDLQNDLNKLNNQITTGKRVNSPADDPVAAARILELNNAKTVNDIYTNTRKTATTTLETYETNLTSVTSVIQDVQSALVAAGNGSYDDAQRSSIATELQSRLETLLSLANAQNSQGNYMYSGAKTGSAAYVDDGSGNLTFNGNSTRMRMQVVAPRFDSLGNLTTDNQMNVTFTGDNVFQANGNDLFATLKNTITLLNTPITDSTTQANFTTGLADSISKVQGSLDQVLNVRAEIGSKLNQIDTLDVTGNDLSLQYDTSLSSLEDLDYNQALSDLSKKNIILEAAQKAFIATTSTNLFDLI